MGKKKSIVLFLLIVGVTASLLSAMVFFSRVFVQTSHIKWTDKEEAEITKILQGYGYSNVKVIDATIESVSRGSMVGHVITYVANATDRSGNKVKVGVSTDAFNIQKNIHNITAPGD